MRAAPLIIIICLLLIVIVSTVILKYDWPNNNNPDYSITLVLDSDYDFFKKGNLVCFINNPNDYIVFSGGDTLGEVDSTYTLNKRTHVKLKI